MVKPRLHPSPHSSVHCGGSPHTSARQLSFTDWSCHPFVRFLLLEKKVNRVVFIFMSLTRGLIAHCSLLVAHCSPFITGCMHIAHCSLLPRRSPSEPSGALHQNGPPLLPVDLPMAPAPADAS